MEKSVQLVETIMAAKNNHESLHVKKADVVEEEIAKGEQDDLLEDYSKSKRERLQKLRSKTLASRIKKHTHSIPRSTIESESRNQRIKDLARPTKQRVLITLYERGSTLPSSFVDNLIRIIEAESCLTPEEAAQVRRKKRRTKTETRLPRTKKWMQEISKDIKDTTMLDKDAVMCQYLMAKHFVKSILQYQCCTSKKDIREIADVIERRLMSYEAYADARNDDRAAQQLRLLADIVACWIAEILVEVASIRKHALAEYCEKRKMKMEIEMNDNNAYVVSNETQDWKQMELKKEKERQERKENKNKFETERENEIAEKENKNENEEQNKENMEGEVLTKNEKESKQQIEEEIKKEKDDNEQDEGNMEKTEEFKEEVKEE